jgi:hypothetical protein
LSYYYICLQECIYTELRDACVGVGIVVLGMSGIKPAGEGIFGYFGRGELETTDLGSGIGVDSSGYPYIDGVGVLLARGGYELASV